MRRVRIGIIGAGWAVRNRHLPAIKKIPGVELGYIWSRSPDKAREVAAEFGGARVATHWQQLIQAPELDAVVMATPPALHLPATLAALNAAKPVLCQAPI